MWRVCSVMVRRSPRFLQMVGGSGCAPGSAIEGSRDFSRRVRGGLDDPTEELREMQEAEKEKKREEALPAADMEFYNQLGEYEVEDDEEESRRLDEEQRQKREEVQKELDSRTGRSWTDPWEITEEQWMSTNTGEDLPEWSSDYVSRISQERVKIHPDGIPSLATLASTELPPSPPQHPGLGEAKAYSKYRKQSHYRSVAEKVREIAKPKLDNILSLSSWDDKQDAVDELFETVEEELKDQEEILGKHPSFGSWVERALEEYLQDVKKGAHESKDAGDSSLESASPLFMDCFSDSEPDAMVPSILSPLKSHSQHGPGRMVEEWELSAHKKTKRILIRQSSVDIAKTLEKNESSRIFVHGREGVGKTAVLASIVASARKSGYIVWYLPDGDRLRKNGFFVTPNPRRDGMFDLQNLSQEACAQLMASHKPDLEGLEADIVTMEKYFKETQLKRITGYSGDSMSIIDLLDYSQERKIHAPMCYSVVLDTLMNQEDKPFLLVMDEFNCFYDYGQYYHMAYDPEVRSPIPYEKINLFEHALGAMRLSTGSKDEDTPPTTSVKKGGILVSVTESHAVPRSVTEAIVASAKRQAEVESSDLHVVEVPRFSSTEVDYILANFEATGIGKLRLDRGDTVMDEQEVAYLKMISGCVGQRLLDASIL